MNIEISQPRDFKKVSGATAPGTQTEVSKVVVQIEEVGFLLRANLLATHLNPFIADTEATH